MQCWAELDDLLCCCSSPTWPRAKRSPSDSNMIRIPMLIIRVVFCSCDMKLKGFMFKHQVMPPRLVWFQSPLNSCWAGRGNRGSVSRSGLTGAQHRFIISIVSISSICRYNIALGWRGGSQWRFKAVGIAVSGNLSAGRRCWLPQ